MPEKSLIIAEKPSAARDIANALGRFKKNGNAYENDDYVIASAVGHVVELVMPEDIDKRLRYWRMESLPIIPEQFELKPIEKNKGRFNELKKLMSRKDVGTLINACDAGREGELIFTYLYEAAGCSKACKRLWMQSMTREGIRQAFQRLRDGEEMRPLQDAARSRSESDWIIGINGTRAVTIRMLGSRRGKVATVGRVQTPTLALVVERERLIRDFSPRTYWRIVGTFDVASGEYEGVYQRPDFKKSDDPDDRADRIWEQAEADRILDAIRDISHAEVTEQKKRTKQVPPRLYDLTSLQREANGRYGFAAGQTLRIAQNLYERHKAITYPRTDSRALPEDYIPTCRETLGKIADSYESARKPIDEDWIKPNKRIFNNSQVSDHFAMIPTGEGSRSFSADEEKIYDMICRRFIAVFYPAAEFDVTTRFSRIGEQSFKTEGKVLVAPGWLDVYGRAGKSDSTLPALSKDDGEPPRARVVSTEKIEDQTRPPPRYTEGTLLTAMETAGKLVDDDELAEAMREKGLGTPATRAQTIDHLMREKYMEREGRELVPTVKAENLIDFLRAVDIRSLVNASLTGEWEHKLSQIEAGTMTREAFMRGITELCERLVHKTKSFEDKQEDGRVTGIISPTDGKPMVETLRAFQSQDKNLSIYKTIASRKLDESEVAELIEKGTIGPLDGFRSRADKPFSAILRLDEENKVKFVFDNGGNGADGNGNDDSELDLNELKVVGESPVDGSPVYETPNAYATEANIKGDRSAFRISRTLLGKTIPTEQMEKLLKERKTDLLERFRSKRTNRYFDAHLTLDDKGKLGFEFPPRPAGKGTKKSATKKKAPKKSE